MRLGPVACALALALLVPSSAATAQPSPTGPQAPAPSAAPSVSPRVTRVLAISVDGLNTRAIRTLGRTGAPTFFRLLDEGAGTLNARTEYEQNVTLPNHTSMMTSRRIDRSRGGHGVTWDDDRPGLTVSEAAGHRVGSVFTVVRAAGGTSALFTTKTKFGLYERSWPRSITRYVADEDQARLVRTATRDVVSTDRRFTFLHVSLPDRYGHEYGGMSPQYLAAVRRTDRDLGRLLRAIEARPRLTRRLTVVLTADHGFAAGLRSHDAKVLANYRIPFLTWGAQVRHGSLYALNPDYRDPARTRPTYTPRRQPVRNGDLGNLAVDLLGLRAIPGSQLDRAHDLDVS
jgi:hypothetical protein